MIRPGAPRGRRRRRRPPRHRGDAPRPLRAPLPRRVPAVAARRARPARWRSPRPDDDVAIVLAGQWLDGMTGSDLLDDARRLHPHAKRALLIHWGQWGDPATGEAIFDAIARARIDHYVIRPTPPPDELFHHAITGMLLEWAESQRQSPHTIHVIGKSWEGRAYELRQLLGRCAMPHAFSLADSPAGRDARRADRGPSEGRRSRSSSSPTARSCATPPTPSWWRRPGHRSTRRAPSSTSSSWAPGPRGCRPRCTARPRASTRWSSTRAGIGGQATSSSLIRNYLGFPRGVSGRRLAQSAYEQAWVFGAQFAFMQFVTMLAPRRRRPLGRPLRERAHPRPRRVARHRRRVPAHRHPRARGAQRRGRVLRRHRVRGLGHGRPGGVRRRRRQLGGPGRAAPRALRQRRSRSSCAADSLAAGMSQYLVGQVEATPRLDVRVATEVVGGGGERRGSSTSCCATAPPAARRPCAADGLFLMIGARPAHRLAARRGRARRPGIRPHRRRPRPRNDAWPLERPPLSLETSMPGVFAAGDARHGSVKRVASAVGEGSVAVQLLHRLFELDTSPRPAWRVRAATRALLTADRDAAWSTGSPC